MRRVSIVGNAGSGKSTFGRALGERLGVEFVELDAIRHQPGWVELPDDEFVARVAAVAAGDAWVIDGNYGLVREATVWPRADTVVWLDLPKPLVMRRITGRTLRRLVLREELWNENRERWQNVASLDPTRSMIVWSWTRHSLYRQRYSAAMADARWAHVDFVRLRSRREVCAFLERARRPGAP